MARRITHHILPTSATMVGVCLTGITVLRIGGNHLETFADELLTATSLLFAVACFLSFASIRRSDDSKLERVADRLFLAGLVGLVLAVGSLAFD